MSGSPLLKVVIPSLNAAAYIDVILSYYEDFAIDVEVHVDTKSQDATRELAKARARVRELPNEATYIEAVLEEMSRAAGSTWVLRIDDDELPTLDMIHFAQHIVLSPESEAIDAVGFPRHQCLLSEDGRLFACRLHSATTAHRQWRLYRPDKVAFHRHLHSPGFDIHPARCRKAPDAASMIHLDWVVHGYVDRRRKLDRYLALVPHNPANDRDYYLFEDAPLARGDLVALPKPEFTRVAHDLAARGFSASLPKSPPSAISILAPV